MYGHVLVRGNHKNPVFLQTSENGDKSAPHQGRDLGSVSMHTVTPDAKEGCCDHDECTMPVIEEEGCEVVNDVAPIPAA